MKASRKATLRYGSPGLAPDERDMIQVGLAGAVSSKTKRFKNIHEKCGTSVNEVKYCPECERKIGAEELEKGFEYAGQLLKFTVAEIEGAKAERSPFIDITKFVPRTELTSMMFNAMYFLVPGEIGAARYGVLYQALSVTKAAGLGRQSLWGKEHPVCVYPNREFETGGVLMMATLHPHEDLVVPDFASPIPSKAGAAEGRAKVEALLGHLEPEDLEPADRARINELINSRLDGAVSPPKDLMAELQKSVKKTPAKRKPRASKSGPGDFPAGY